MATEHTTDTTRAVDDLRRRVVSVLARQESLDVRTRLSRSVGVVMLAGFGILAAESIGYLSSVTREILLSVYFFLVIPGLLAYSCVPLLRRLGVLERGTVENSARMIGRHFPAIRDRLLNIIQLGTPRQHHAWVSSELIEESVATFVQELSGIDLSDSLDRSHVRLSARQAGGVTLCVLAALIAWPGTFSDGFNRLRQYDRDFTPPLTYTISVRPGTVEVAKGTDVEFRVSVRAVENPTTLPRTARLFLRGEGQSGFEPVEIQTSGDGEFTHTLSEVRYSYDYYAQVDDERTEEFRISVLDWPSLRSFRVRLEHPPYARLSPTLQEDFAGDIAALPGTRVTLSGSASKELRSGDIVFSDSSRTDLDVAGVSFIGSFAVTEPGSYSVRVHDIENLTNRSPITYHIRLMPDGAPTVDITQPGRDIDIAGGEPINLFVEASDDYGISGLRLRYRLSHSRYVQVRDDYDALDIPLQGTAPRNVNVSYLWDLGPLDLVPEDVVEYYVEATDNDAVNGPKSSRSALYTLRLPSLEEVFTDLDSDHTQALEQLDETLTEAEKLKRDIESINRDLKTNKEFDWQDQQKAREMTQRVEDIRKQLEKTEQQLKSMTDQMQRQQVLSPETLEKYLELQTLFEQMNTDELQQALRQMQQAMQGVRKDMMQQALQNLEFSEERFRSGIERTLNLLKRIQIEQKMDEASRRAEDLAKAQENLKEEQPGDPDTTANKQEKLADEQGRLEQLLQDLQRRMEEFFTEMPADRLDAMNRELQQQNLQARMKEAARQLRSGTMQQAQQTQQQVQQNLENLSEQLQAMQQQMLANQTEQILNSLRRATTDLLELSERQEETKNESRSAPPNSPSLRDNAQQQMRIMSELNTIAASLSELAQKSFAVTPGMGRSLGEAMQGMQNAMRDLDVRNGAQASQDQTAAMAALNESARQVQQSLEAMMQGTQGSPGGMGLMQQLQMMAGQQMRLNTRTQNLGEGQGESDALRRAAQAARIAREQEAVRKSLEQLQREAKSSGDQDRILGDLEQVAKEMREVVRNLEQNEVDDQTLRRQERILSRLLDASRSMRERDFEKRREARTGKQFTREGPRALPTEETRNWLRQEMLKALEKGYSRDYQELIRTYFEKLERMSADSDR